MLDIRNHQLVRLGEDALRCVEGELLLPPGKVTYSSKYPEFMILTREGEIGQTSFWFKHKTLIRSLEGAVGCGFFLAAFLSFCDGLGS